MDRKATARPLSHEESGLATQPLRMVRASSESPTVARRWVDVLTLWTLIAPLSFGLAAMDYYLRVPLSLVVGGAVALLLAPLGVPAWCRHPATIYVVYGVSLALFIARLGH